MPLDRSAPMRGVSASFRRPENFTKPDRSGNLAGIQLTRELVLNQKNGVLSRGQLFRRRRFSATSLTDSSFCRRGSILTRKSTVLRWPFQAADPHLEPS